MSQYARTHPDEFQSARPRARARPRLSSITAPSRSVSIRAPPSEGATRIPVEPFALTSFQSARPRARARLTHSQPRLLSNGFQSARPRARARLPRSPQGSSWSTFQSARPRARARPPGRRQPPGLTRFNPRAPERGRDTTARAARCAGVVSIRAPPSEGATGMVPPGDRLADVSIRAPPSEGATSLQN